MDAVVRKELFEIDENIDKLVKKIELLDFINPINIEEEKQKFFKSRYTKEPNFKYPEISFDAFEFTTDFLRCIGFRVKGFVVARTAVEPDEDAANVFWAFAFSYCGLGAEF